MEKIIAKIGRIEVELPRKKSTEMFDEYRNRVMDIYFSYFAEEEEPSYNVAYRWATEVIAQNYPDSDIAIEYNRYIEAKKSRETNNEKKTNIFKKYLNWRKKKKEKKRLKKEAKKTKRKEKLRNLKNKFIELFKRNRSEEDKKIAKLKRKVKKEARKEKFANFKIKAKNLFRRKNTEEIIDLEESDYMQIDDEDVVENIFEDYNQIDDEDVVENIFGDNIQTDEDVAENNFGDYNQKDDKGSFSRIFGDYRDYIETDDEDVAENNFGDYNQKDDKGSFSRIFGDYIQTDEDVVGPLNENSIKETEMRRQFNQMLAEQEAKAQNEQQQLRQELENIKKQLEFVKAEIPARQQQAVEDYKKMRQQRKEYLRQRRENPEVEPTTEEIVNNPLITNEYKKEVLSSLPVNSTPYTRVKTQTKFIDVEIKKGPASINLMNGCVQIRKDEFDMLVDSAYRLQKGVMVPNKTYTVRSTKSENDYYERVLSEKYITEISTPDSDDASYMILPEARYQELLSDNEKYCNFVIHKNELKELEIAKKEQTEQLERSLEEMRRKLEKEMEEKYNAQTKELVRKYGELPKQKVIKK